MYVEGRGGGGGEQRKKKKKKKKTRSLKMNFMHFYPHFNGLCGAGKVYYLSKGFKVHWESFWS